jgi:hypothetical protein
MDSLDVRLLDDELQAEIQMVTELMEAANLSEGPLTPQHIDAVLGCVLAAPGPAASTAPEQVAVGMSRLPKRPGRVRPQTVATSA